MGCGRGDTVCWLLERDWDAWGVDIDFRYVDIGREYLRATRNDPDRLTILTEGTSGFPDSWFDVIISDQVFEHVLDLDGLVEEISRVSRPGAVGMHIFPARWRLIEPHMNIPVVHWLPKGRVRRSCLSALLYARLGVDYFGDRPVRERAEIFARFSNDETFYRSLRTLAKTMNRHGVEAEVVAASRSKVVHHAPWLPARLAPAAGWLYRNAFSVCMETIQL